jgi:hypothetical protein
MPFVISVGFATEHDRDDFEEKILPKIRGHKAEPPQVEGAEKDALYRIGVAVTSQTAAKDLCHQIVGFLAHAKNSRVDVAWIGADGQLQVGEVNAGAAREAEILAVRVGASAKAHMDAEKAGK